MKILRQIIFWALPILVLGTQSESNAANLKGLNLLQDVAFEKKEDKLTVRFTFRDPVQSYKPASFYKKSAQVDLPGVYIDPAKRYFVTQDSDIPQVHLAQFDPRTVRARFIFNEDGSSKKDDFDIETKGNILTVRINKKEIDFLSRLLAQTAETVEAAELEPEDKNTESTANMESTLASLGNTASATKNKADDSNYKKEAAAKAISEKSAEPSYLDIAKSGNAFDESPSILKLFTMLAIVLSLMLTLFYIFKKFVLKNTPFGNGENIVKVLGTGFIAPRKHIALVEVAGQILALGVSKDNISFLTEIDNPEMIEKIKSPETGNIAKNLGKKLQIKKKAKAAPKAVKADSDKLSESAFNKYMKDFDDEQPGINAGKEDSVAAVTQQIRKRMGKARIA